MLVVGLSLAHTELHFQIVGGGGGAILASLTPAAALGGGPTSPRANPLDRLVRTLDDASAASPEPPRATPAGSNLLAELDRSVSAPAKSAASPSSTSKPSGSADGASPVLDTADNPWAHASAAALNVTKVRELWAAVKPCWRGEIDEGAASIRVVLGSHGEVQSMTALEAAGQAKSAALALAAAVNACAPYRIGAADAYLVTGPA